MNKNKTNYFSISQVVNKIYNASSKERFVLSIINLLGSVVFGVILYLSVYFYFLNPWPSLKILSQSISIIFSIISSFLFITFLIYQVVSLYSSYKTFIENKIYFIFSVLIYVINIISVIILVHYTLLLF